MKNLKDVLFKVNEFCEYVKFPPEEEFFIPESISNVLGAIFGRNIERDPASEVVVTDNETLSEFEKSGLNATPSDVLYSKYIETSILGSAYIFSAARKMDMPKRPVRELIRVINEAILSAGRSFIYAPPNTERPVYELIAEVESLREQVAHEPSQYATLQKKVRAAEGELKEAALTFERVMAYKPNLNEAVLKEMSKAESVFLRCIETTVKQLQTGQKRTFEGMLRDRDLRALGYFSFAANNISNLVNLVYQSIQFYKSAQKK